MGKESRPDMILVILPESAATVYRDVKRFGDITVGVVTQCVVGYNLKMCNVATEKCLYTEMVAKTCE